MTAINVYGVSLGDQFIAADGNTLTVEEFITPASHIKPWKARVVINDSDTHAEVDVKDLKTYRRITS